MSIVIFTDASAMPFGTHKGKALIDVPASYFIYLRDQPTWNKRTPLGVYIEDNLQVLQQQVKEAARNDKFLRR